MSYSIYVFLVFWHQLPVHGVVTTLQQDVDALLKFKEELSNSELLHSWNPKTILDPCDGDTPWYGVTCNCEASTLPTLMDAHPCGDSSHEGENLKRVYGLELTQSKGTKPIAGHISAALGNLTELRYLNLYNNELSGSIPAEFGNLANLETAVLDSNQLTGSLPPSFGDREKLPFLRVALLGDNNLKGRLPTQWCNLTDGMYVDITGNRQLCQIATEKSCLFDSAIGDDVRVDVETIKGAIFLFDNYDDESCCDATPPECVNTSGCRVSVPSFWTEPSYISFNYTNFTNTNTDRFNSSLHYDAVIFLDTDSKLALPETYCLKLQGDSSDLLVAWKQENIQDVAETVGNINMVNINANANNSVLLSSGNQYSVLVVARDNKCRSVCSHVLSSNNVTVDYRPPLPSSEVYNTDHFVNLQPPIDPSDYFGISFTKFSSTVRCCNYTVFVTDQTGKNVSDVVDIHDRQAFNIPVQLRPGNTYTGHVCGESVSGLRSPYPCGFTQTVEIKAEENNTTTIICLSVFLGLGLPAAMAGLGWLYWKNRRKKAQALEAQRRNQALEEFKSLLISMRKKTESHLRTRSIVIRAPRSPSASLAAAKEEAKADADGAPVQLPRSFAFVITDLENSTACAACDKKAYQIMQLIHDQVLREEIPKHNGWEIGTQGDSFEIAFNNVADAVLFCTTVQLRLLHTLWPDDVLRLPSNNEVRDEDGIVCFRGPRVRMGVHWAQEGRDVRCSEHSQTRLQVFDGPAWEVANEVADAGGGGQVLITHAVWAQLRYDMGVAGYPVVRRIGLFLVSGETMWLYEVQRPLSGYLFRSFPLPRKLHVVLEDGSYDVVVPPVQATDEEGSGRRGRRYLLHDDKDVELSTMAKEPLVFVSVRLSLFPGLEGPPCVSGKLRAACVDTHETKPAPRSPGAGPRWLLRAMSSRFMPVPNHVVARITQHIMAVAMQFNGYQFGRKSLETNMMMFAFREIQEALFFCHAVQLLLLVVPYGVPQAQLVRLFGASVNAPDGRRVFHGPRVAMSINASNSYTSYRSNKHAIQLEGVEWWPDAVEYSGEGVEYAKAISSCAAGGQVVMTLQTWEKVAAQLPAHVQVLSLGEHVLHDGLNPLCLVEVMPAQLAMRTFGPLISEHQLSKGYRDSPSPYQRMALCYIKVSKPIEVHSATISARQHSHQDSENRDACIQLLTNFYMGVYMVENTARQLLTAHDGYECKHPQPGKFTLAFSDLEQCLRFCCELQLELLNLPWPDQLLEWKDCSPQHINGALVFCGLRVSMGVTFDLPDLRKPLNTGRADYFGNMANLAARLCASARPAQILVAACAELNDMCKRVGEDGAEDSQVSASLRGSLVHAADSAGTASGMATIGDTAHSRDSVPWLIVGSRSSWKEGNAMLLRHLGFFSLKGIDDAEVYEVVHQQLRARTFPPHTNAHPTPSGTKAQFPWSAKSPSDIATMRSPSSSFKPRCLASFHHGSSSLNRSARRRWHTSTKSMRGQRTSKAQMGWEADVSVKFGQKVAGMMPPRTSMNSSAPLDNSAAMRDVELTEEDSMVLDRVSRTQTPRLIKSSSDDLLRGTESVMLDRVLRPSISKPSTHAGARSPPAPCSPLHAQQPQGGAAASPSGDLPCPEEPRRITFAALHSSQPSPFAGASGSRRTSAETSSAAAIPEDGAAGGDSLRQSVSLSRSPMTTSASVPAPSLRTLKSMPTLSHGQMESAMEVAKLFVGCE